jgi:hypothetical protein
VLAGVDAIDNDSDIVLVGSFDDDWFPSRAVAEEVSRLRSHAKSAARMKLIVRTPPPKAVPSKKQ